METHAPGRGRVIRLAPLVRTLPYRADGLNGRFTADIKAPSAFSLRDFGTVDLSYNNTGKSELTWVFINYAPNADLKARSGRLGWGVYLPSDSPNIGYGTRPLLAVPQ